MRKPIKCFIPIALSCIVSFSNAQVMNKGDHSLNIYYGYSVFRSYYINVAELIAEDENLDYSISTTGPFGLMYEYMLADVIGLGGELGYSASEFNWVMDGVDINFNPAKWNYKVNFATTRVQMRFNLHLIKNEHFDTYLLFNVGYRRTKFTVDTDDPFYIPEYSVPFFFPIGVKSGLGVRYFFLKNIGLNAEFAIGSPIISGGLSVRF
ncbi:MAG: porin family protein [Bacteroidia bacterium]|nr:porin family protein [Bacteroidia bacterium]